MLRLYRREVGSLPFSPLPMLQFTRRILLVRSSFPIRMYLR